MSHSYVRIPPDSTGKRILHEERRVLTYDGISNGPFEKGQVIQKSGDATVYGTISGVYTLNYSAGKGKIYLEDNSNNEWVDNDTITVVTPSGISTTATVNVSASEGDPTETIFLQKNIITDADTPEYKMQVSSDGALKTSFNNKIPFVEAQGEIITSARKLVYAPSFDYNYIDENKTNIEYRVKISSKTWPTLPTSGDGTPIFGETSGATGMMCAFPGAFPNQVYITDTVGTWAAGETVRAAEDPANHFFVLDAGSGGYTMPIAEINDNTLSLNLTLSEDSPVNIIDGSEFTHLIYTSNIYIPQARAESTTIDISGSVNVQTAQGVTRRHGIFDDFNGVYFELTCTPDGTPTTYGFAAGSNVDTGGIPKFYVVHRSNVSGSVVEHRIAQDDFNENKIDGTDAQGFVANFENLSRLWIDWPGGGAGIVEFGIYDDRGVRIVFHKFKLQNSSLYTNNATDGNKLPVRTEIFTNGSLQPTVETKIKIAEAYVSRNTLSNALAMSKNMHGNATDYYENLDDSRGEVPIFGIQANKLLNGKTNRMYGRLNDLNVNLLDSRTTRTFDDTAVTVANQITLKNHGFITGDSVLFKQGSGVLGSLVDYDYYYVVRVDDDTISIAASYVDAVNGTPLIAFGTGGSQTGHTLEEPSDTSVLLRLRVNSSVADSIWTAHNSTRSGASSTNGTGTGFRLSPFITVANGGTSGAYQVGDLLELDSGIIALREAVLEVTSVNAGAITGVRIANNSVAHLTEADGSTSANFGSYNGKISSSVGHKADGVGETVIAGSAGGALFNVTVEWGHGFWWVENYAKWNEWNFHESHPDEMFEDFAFALSESTHKQQNLILTAQTKSAKLHNAKVTASMNWLEII